MNCFYWYGHALRYYYTAQNKSFNASTPGPPLLPIVSYKDIDNCHCKLVLPISVIHVNKSQHIFFILQTCIYFSDKIVFKVLTFLLN